MWRLAIAWALTLTLMPACKSSPATGAERGACYGNGTCNAGLVCRSKLCVADAPASPTAGAAAATAPSTAPAMTTTAPALPAAAPATTTPAQGPPATTAILLDYDDGAAVMACAVDGKLVKSAWKCSQAITGELAVQSLAGTRRVLGKPKTLTCEPGPGNAADKHAGFALDKAAGDPPEDPLAEILIWPAARADAATRWNPHPKVDVAALTRRAAELARGLSDSNGEPGARYELQGRPITVAGSLAADLDGDHRPDTLYSIVLPAEDPTFWAPRYLLASLAARPGELLVLQSSTLEELLPLAAIDLDGDGRDEIVISMPYYEGASSYVAHLGGGTLETLGGWGCGL